MNFWLEIATGASCAAMIAGTFYAGTIAGELRAAEEFDERRQRQNEQYTTVLLRWLRENRRKDRLIEQMKRAGRKRREAYRDLRDRAIVTRLVLNALAESGESIVNRSVGLDDALRDIMTQCARSSWQQKRIRHILKKHRVSPYDQEAPHGTAERS